MVLLWDTEVLYVLIFFEELKFLYPLPLFIQQWFDYILLVYIVAYKLFNALGT